MNTPEILSAILGVVRCALCSAPYEGADMAPVGTRETYTFVRLSCHVCGQHGLGVLIVREIDARSVRAPLSADDVLSAHEALRGYSGDALALFR